MLRFILLCLLFFASGAMAADNVKNIDLYTISDTELANQENTCTLPPLRTDGTPLAAADIVAIHWYTCLNCAAPNDGGGEPESAYALAYTLPGPFVTDADCRWPRDLSNSYTDGDVEAVRAIAEATDGGGGTVSSVLSPDRGFFVFAGTRPSAPPGPPTGIK